VTEQALPAQAITVFLVDDHGLFRTGVNADLSRAGSAVPTPVAVSR